MRAHLPYCGKYSSCRWSNVRAVRRAAGQPVRGTLVAERAGAPPVFFWRSSVVLDEVTRFFQRRHFDEQLEARLLQAEREKRRLAILLVDADGISRVNERWGRATGDAIMV